MKTLRPQPIQDNYWQDIESQLKKIFYEIAFAPLIQIIRKATPQGKQLDELLNSGGNLISLMIAIRRGRIQYKNGVFAGDFNVSISKDLKAIGASYDSRSSTFRLSVGEVPEFIRAESALYQSVAEAAHQTMIRRLDEIQTRIDSTVEELEIDTGEMSKAVEHGWRDSAVALEVQPKLDRNQAEELSKDYNRNIKLSINDFSKQSVVQLREIVEKNAMEGFRFDKLTDDIRHRYGVTINKARFLARQETGLFMAKYRKQRFSQAGVRRYKWSTSKDERVRDSHRRLNGTVWSYESPPVTDRNNGARNNPGEDFNCRCVDIPILEQEASLV